MVNLNQIVKSDRKGVIFLYWWMKCLLWQVAEVQIPYWWKVMLEYLEDTSLKGITTKKGYLCVVWCTIQVNKFVETSNWRIFLQLRLITSILFMIAQFFSYLFWCAISTTESGPAPGRIRTFPASIRYLPFLFRPKWENETWTSTHRILILKAFWKEIF